jgi:hypothetical protein
VAQDKAILIGQSDQVNGGILPANLRLLASLDYAVNYNLMVGVRLGYALLTFPGNAYTAFPPIHLEGRATYVIGHEALVTKGFAPVVFLAAGAAPFAGKVGVLVYECDNGGNPTSPGLVVNNGKAGSGIPGKNPTETCAAGSNTGKGPGGSVGHQADAWRIAGPVFVAPGGGVRYAFSDRAALSLNLKLALAFGNGIMFDPTPEFAFQYGF